MSTSPANRQICRVAGASVVTNPARPSPTARPVRNSCGLLASGARLVRRRSGPFVGRGSVTDRTSSGGRPPLPGDQSFRARSVPVAVCRPCTSRTEVTTDIAESAFSGWARTTMPW